MKTDIHREKSEIEMKFVDGRKKNIDIHVLLIGYKNILFFQEN